MAGRKRILIADDDPDIVDLLETYFSSKYDVEVVTNGKDALQKAESEKFDIILLDVMMPYIDGYHVAYELASKQEQGVAGPKIIIMTSRDVSSEKGIALLSGACDVMQKPFSLKDIQSKIDEVLS